MSCGDPTESRIYDAIKAIPVVGAVYSVPRMVVYGAMGDGCAALKSATGMAGNLAETALVVGGFGGAGLPGAAAGAAVSAGVWQGLGEIDKVAENEVKRQELARKNH